MKYRIFGNTGLKVSALGFGCMRLPVTGNDQTRIDEGKASEMVRLAIDRGLNYIDTAYTYHTHDFSKGGSSEPFLARILREGYREKVYLATKLPVWLVNSREDMDLYLDEQLERLGTDKIDFYLLHSLKRSYWEKMVKYGVFEFLDHAAGTGRIGYAGFSFHDDIHLFREIVDAYPWTFCQIQYNYFDLDFQAGREGLEYAARRGLAVAIMEPLRGGSLINNLPEEARQAMNRAVPGRSEAEWAFRWLWHQPGISVVISGMSDLKHVVENLDLAGDVSDAAWNAIDQTAIEKVRDSIGSLQKVDCTYCGYCLPCPEGVNIPLNLALYNAHHIFGDKNARMRYWNVMNENERASACTECGDCEEKCPQQIRIRSELKQTADLFSR